MVSIELHSASLGWIWVGGVVWVLCGVHGCFLAFPRIRSGGEFVVVRYADGDFDIATSIWLLVRVASPSDLRRSEALFGIGCYGRGVSGLVVDNLEQEESVDGVKGFGAGGFDADSRATFDFGDSVTNV